MDMSIVRDFVKILCITMFSYFILVKITNYKMSTTTKNLLAIFCSISISVFYLLINFTIDSISSFVISLIIFGFLVKKIIKFDKAYYAIAYVLSFAISYIIYLLGIIVSAVALSKVTSNHKSIIFVFAIPTFATIFLIILYKLRRFKNGFNFFNSDKVNKNITILTLLFSGLALILLIAFINENTKFVKIWLVFAVILIAIGLFISIKTLITSFYKKSMRDRTVEIQVQEIEEQKKTIEDLKNENLQLATVIHKYNSRLSALENGVRKAMENCNTEFSAELSVILNETENLSKEIDKASIIKKKLPKTNILGIDNMFEYMAGEAEKSGIDFTLKLLGSVNYLIDEIIPKDKFETLIGDHLKDAIIAINSSNNSYKSILVVLGVVQDAYELSIYDTGIEFDIDTLLRLGLERVTTHEEEGGSGIGFMTTFETLKECKASLIIEEFDNNTTDYTKSVSIRFDGKHEYRIRSYRYAEIKKLNKQSRVIIEKL